MYLNYYCYVPGMYLNYNILEGIFKFQNLFLDQVICRSIAFPPKIVAGPGRNQLNLHILFKFTSKKKALFPSLPPLRLVAEKKREKEQREEMKEGKEKNKGTKEKRNKRIRKSEK
ncbi:hypothetical protein RhiirA5_373670 [Rhizophagus irregularis]|uniref:Uncharacterized protein n=1 Tax=Rhizophagus irregularis TaxID=588596 RepID=A0A2N0PY20_9GLOM|nr:hypothetical protein RhiirA5_373670 [Rhizophagus irregularis]